MEVGMMIGEENDKAVINELKLHITTQLQLLNKYIRSTQYISVEELENMKELKLTEMNILMSEVVVDQEYLNPTVEDLKLKIFFDDSKKKLVKIFDEVLYG